MVIVEHLLLITENLLGLSLAGTKSLELPLSTVPIAITPKSAEIMVSLTSPWLRFVLFEPDSDEFHFYSISLDTQPIIVMESFWKQLILVLIYEINCLIKSLTNTVECLILIGPTSIMSMSTGNSSFLIRLFNFLF